jgi:hypothetical protein
MKLTEDQKNHIINLYEGLKNDEQTIDNDMKINNKKIVPDK